MTKQVAVSTREEKLAVLWAALKTLPDKYQIHTAMPDGVPVEREFIGHDLPRCIEVLEARIERFNRDGDKELLVRWRAKLEAERGSAS